MAKVGVTILGGFELICCSIYRYDVWVVSVTNYIHTADY